mmetsp:Transcript_30885/g.64760  ORF Transcript_30885/g.64760 Transcript_30885/m.64760 type:complete len:209 (-) Transcript_30885:253-879(-)
MHTRAGYDGAVRIRGGSLQQQQETRFAWLSGPHDIPSCAWSCAPWTHVLREPLQKRFQREDLIPRGQQWERDGSLSRLRFARFVSWIQNRAPVSCRSTAVSGPYSNARTCWAHSLPFPAFCFEARFPIKLARLRLFAQPTVRVFVTKMVPSPQSTRYGTSASLAASISAALLKADTSSTPPCTVSCKPCSPPRTSAPRFSPPSPDATA